MSGFPWGTYDDDSIYARAYIENAEQNTADEFTLGLVEAALQRDKAEREKAAREKENSGAGK